jgi:hypothetical protein
MILTHRITGHRVLNADPVKFAAKLVGHKNKIISESHARKLKEYDVEGRGFSLWGWLVAIHNYKVDTNLPKI